MLLITTQPCQQHANCSYITRLYMTNLPCRQETGIISCHDVKQKFTAELNRTKNCPDNQEQFIMPAILVIVAIEITNDLS